MSEARKKQPPGIVVYWEIFEMLHRMTPDQSHALLNAMYEYGHNEIEPDFSSDPVLDIVWPLVANHIQADKEKYKHTSTARAEAGSKGGTAKANNSKQNVANVANATFGKQIKPTTTTTTTTTATTTADNKGVEDVTSKRSKRFSPPTVLQVQEYSTEKGYGIDAQRFVDFYTSKGWRVGNTPMKDWKAAVRNWASRNGGKANGNDCSGLGASVSKPQEYKPAPYELYL